MTAKYLWAACLLTCGAWHAARAAQSFDPAAAFGSRRSVTHLRLSPDGGRVVFIKPTVGQGSAAVTLKLTPGAKPHLAIAADGKPDRLGGCNWVSNRRLVCTVYGTVRRGRYGLLLPFTRLVAVDADGGNLSLLSMRPKEYSRGVLLRGGDVLDWLPNERDAVLMTRHYLPDDHLGTRLGSTLKGLGVDRVDTRTLATQQVEAPRKDAAFYLTDGRGSVRIMGILDFRAGDQISGVVTNLYRKKDSRNWHKLGDYDAVNDTGFYVAAVDPDLNVAYGFEKKDNRFALYSIALDGSMRKRLLYARPGADVDGVMELGRHRRVVGVTYSSNQGRGFHIIDPTIGRLTAAFARALPKNDYISIVDANSDESELAVLASGNHDPGAYYLYSGKDHQLRAFYVVRDGFEDANFGTVTPITYPAADGTTISGSLTLPPGRKNGKGLPAIVLLHRSAAARHERGFDWLSQYFANRGFAVLQPNYRGSHRTGEAWYKNGDSRSWRTRVSDVLTAGRWLVAQGIADPSKLGIVGWSFGGYVALQSAVTDPSVYKAVIAIAPVTDLQAFKEQSRHWTDFAVVSRYVGSGPQVREASPADNAAKIKVPVLLFHGTMDHVAYVNQSQLMADSLQAAGEAHELVTFDGLGHRLDDSAARAQLLRESDAFLRKSMGLAVMTANAH